MCLGVLLACVSVYTYVCLVLREARREQWTPWNCIYRWLWATMWVLGIKQYLPEELHELLSTEPSLQP